MKGKQSQMNETDVLIIGGSAAGLVAGITARRHYKEAKITIVRKQKEGEVLIPCGIPYIFGTIGEPEKNTIPDELLYKNNIDLIVDEATSIDREEKTVSTKGDRTISYEKLVLATGSEPVILPIPGRDLENVFSARKDMNYLKGLLRALEGVEDVIIIGGGFVGGEFGDEFRKRGLNVTIVEILPHCLQLVFDEDFCALAEDKLEERGLNLRTNSRVEEILEEEGKARGVKLANGEEIEADMVFFGVGVRPNTKLAGKADLKIGETGGIWVDEYGRTSDKDIFAIGDCAEKRSFFTKKPSALKLASIATNEGRIAGANLFELKRKNEGVIGTFSTIIGDKGFGMAGLTEVAAEEEGFEFVTGEFKCPDKHPGAMPGTKEIRMKLLFERATREILGSQLCGGPSTGEIANVMAALMEKKAKAEEMATFQMGTHPFLTASPIGYPIVNAAEEALAKL